MKNSYELLKWDATILYGKIVVRAKATAMDEDGVVIRHGGKGSPPVEHEIERAVDYPPKSKDGPQAFASKVAKLWKDDMDREVNRVLKILGKAKDAPGQVSGVVKLDL